MKDQFQLLILMKTLFDTCDLLIKKQKKKKNGKWCEWHWTIEMEDKLSKQRINMVVLN